MCPFSNRESCYGCGACVVACPQTCIRMAADSEGFDYPEVDESRCSQCGVCRSVCGAGLKVESAALPNAYAAWHQVPQVRAEGTSGSVFTALAATVISEGGVVAGAAFSPDYRSVCHAVADSDTGLADLRGSKYVQSSTEACFRDVLVALRAGRDVLFSGTPCQVQALQRLARGCSSRLTTCDLVCHGVPSPGVFRSYLCELEEKKASRITRYRFRDKQLGWNFPRVAVTYADGSDHRWIRLADRFLNGFYAGVLLRPSCYLCPFTCSERVGDLTLGDCWRVAASHPCYDDNKGTSLVLVSSARGASLLEKAKASGSLFVGEYALDLACQRNTALRAPTPRPPNRKLFFEQFFRTRCFGKASLTYVRPWFIIRKRVEQAVKQLLWPILRRHQ